MSDQFVEAVIQAGGGAIVDGHAIDTAATPDPYTAIYRHVATLAREDEAVLVRGVDRTQGSDVAWFTVDGRGHATAATAPDAGGRRLAEGPADSPTDEAGAGLTAGEPGASGGVRSRPSPVTTARPSPTTPESVIFVRPPRSAPQQGFRAAVHRLTGGAVNLGPGARQVREEARNDQIARHLDRPYSTAFLSFKGGIGKTSTTVGIGLIMAEIRGAPPCAIDANPDSGDLAERLLGQNILDRMDVPSITGLVHDIGSVRCLTDLQRYVLQKGRFHFVAGEQDPAVSDSLTAEDYLRTLDLLQQYYGVVLTDCGTGVTHNAMRGILSRADSVVVAAGYAVSGAERAANTLTWLGSHGYEHLANDALVVLTDKDEVSNRVHKDVIRDHLSSMCRGVFVVPPDESVADGDRISLANVRPRTRDAYAEVAAALVDGYR